LEQVEGESNCSFSKSFAEEIILKEYRGLKRLKRGFLKIYPVRYKLILAEIA
jgi:hypothetical protein